MEYESEIDKVLLVYRIDLNERSCRLDSDSALLYSDYTAGWDTCTTIISQFEQCDYEGALRGVRDSGVKTYISYAAYAWLTPLVFFILAHVLHSAKVEIFYPVLTDNICLIPSGWTHLLLFTGPIYFYILLNVVLCMSATVKVFKAGNSITANDEKKKRRKK
ncbi:uncharacterized protein [Watersipora subatra]|uniref:uncharacterized protein n=1 Tax=Watersipora subatra TaxID=2589382 RepID=UPI00355AE94F